MMTRWSVTDYIAKLPDMPLAELCARLRGEYSSDVRSGPDVRYGRHPLHAEAARRLEAMQAEIERLEGIERMVRAYGVLLPGGTGGLFG